MAPVQPETGIWTWEEFAALEDEPPFRSQVLDGELFVSPHGARRHQRLALLFAVRLHTYVEHYDLGQCIPQPNLVLGPGGYVIPDFVFLPRERLPGTGGPPDGAKDVWVDVAPALIIEILSPSTAKFDRVTKKRAYREFGVDEYWIVDPEAEHVEVYKFEGAGIGKARNGGDQKPPPRDERQIHRHHLTWQPDPGIEELEIDLRETFAEA